MPGLINPLGQKMEISLFNRPKNRQREKIIRDVFANHCSCSTSCAKNFDSSSLQEAGKKYFRDGDSQTRFAP